MWQLFISLTIFFIATLMSPFSISWANESSNRVVARIGDEEVLQKDIDLFILQLSNKSRQIARKQLEPLVLKEIVNSRLLSRLARADGLHKRESYRRLVALTENRILKDMYLDEQKQKIVSEDAILVRYRVLSKKMKGPKQVKAQHILVRTRPEAEAIIKKIQRGLSFEFLAKEYSIGPSGPSGGNLGFFSKEQMVPSFSDVAFNLNIDDVSAPIKTKFGWHIVKVTDQRYEPLPTLAKMRSKIISQLFLEMREGILKKARKEVPVVIFSFN